MFQNVKSEIKIFFIVAAIAIILTIGVIFLLRDDARNQVSPTPSPLPNGQSAIDTSTWQTYRSDDFGFELRYPVGWISVNPWRDTYEFASKEMKETGERFQIRISESKEQSGFKIFEGLQYLGPREVFLLQDDPYLFTYTKRKDFMMQGYRAIEFTEENDVPIRERSRGEQIIVEKGRVVFNFAMVLKYGGDKRDGVTFQDIFSTFRFVDEIESL